LSATTTASAASASSPPKPTATPVNEPGAIAAAYLAAWNAGNYADMYALISADAKQKISQDDFVQRYNAIRVQATISNVNATLQPGQRAGANIQQFSVAFDTVLVGKIEERNTMTLGVDPGGSAWRVQWLPSLIFKELTGDNIVHMIPIDTPRGDIRDRAGKSLATVGKVTTVALVPGKITDEQAMLSQLSGLLNVPAAVIKQKYAQSQADVPVQIKTISLSEATPIRQRLAAIPGVQVTDDPARVYPAGALAAQTIGYLSQVTDEDLKKLAVQGYYQGDVVGRSGVEQWGESALAGRRGGKLLVTSRQFDPVTTIAERAATKPGAVYLTLDIGLQQRSEQLLGKRPGSIGVMRVSDGSLLAIASYPGFDPNQFILGISAAAYQQLFNDPLGPFVNRLIDGRYATGSVFKPITMAAALDHAGYTADSTFDCPGYYVLDNTRWADWKAHGRVGMVEALTQSCDVANYTMGHQEDVADQTLLPKEAQAFGLGRVPDIVGLGSANAVGAAGVVPSPAWKQNALGEGWLPKDAVNLSIGQGYLLASPVQVLNVYAAIANGGTLWTPRIIDKAVDANGAVTDSNAAKPLGTLPASADALHSIRQGLRGVTSDETGTAFRAFQGFGVPTAGKTGTAQAGSGQPHAWFAVYAPFDQPEVAVVTIVEHGGEGAAVAAPIVRSVLEAYFGARH